ncbi:MAG: hypothetical protein QI223_05585 [Candidatus Korarchaeota archaeon]|nr:hypothetical protein [Candidatus Korarchaeota archaeon]
MILGGQAGRLEDQKPPELASRVYCPVLPESAVRGDLLECRNDVDLFLMIEWPRITRENWRGRSGPPSRGE